MDPRPPARREDEDEERTKPPPDADQRSRDYIRLLEQRNRLLRRMEAKKRTKAQREKEKREKGFTVYMSGANKDAGPAQPEAGAAMPAQRERRRRKPGAAESEPPERAGDPLPAWARSAGLRPESCGDAGGQGGKAGKTRRRQWAVDASVRIRSEDGAVVRLQPSLDSRGSSGQGVADMAFPRGGDADAHAAHAADDDEPFDDAATVVARAEERDSPPPTPRRRRRVSPSACGRAQGSAAGAGDDEKEREDDDEDDDAAAAYSDSFDSDAGAEGSEAAAAAAAAGPRAPSPGAAAPSASPTRPAAAAPAAAPSARHPAATAAALLVRVQRLPATQQQLLLRVLTRLEAGHGGEEAVEDGETEAIVRASAGDPEAWRHIVAALGGEGGGAPGRTEAAEAAGAADEEVEVEAGAAGGAWLLLRLLSAHNGGGVAGLTGVAVLGPSGEEIGPASARLLWADDATVAAAAARAQGGAAAAVFRCHPEVAADARTCSLTPARAAQTLARLTDGVARTREDAHMWKCPLTRGADPARPAVLLRLPAGSPPPCALRVWNYNRSLPLLSLGVAGCEVWTAAGPAWRGELRRGCGNAKFEYAETLPLRRGPARAPGPAVEALAAGAPAAGGGEPEARAGSGEGKADAAGLSESAASPQSPASPALAALAASAASPAAPDPGTVGSGAGAGAGAGALPAAQGADRPAAASPPAPPAPPAPPSPSPSPPPPGPEAGVETPPRRRSPAPSLDPAAGSATDALRRSIEEDSAVAAMPFGAPALMSPPRAAAARLAGRRAQLLAARREQMEREVEEARMAREAREEERHRRAQLADSLLQEALGAAATGSQPGPEAEEAGAAGAAAAGGDAAVPAARRRSQRGRLRDPAPAGDGAFGASALAPAPAPDTGEEAEEEEEAEAGAAAARFGRRAGVESRLPSRRPAGRAPGTSLHAVVAASADEGARSAEPPSAPLAGQSTEGARPEWTESTPARASISRAVIADGGRRSAAVGAAEAAEVALEASADLGATLVEIPELPLGSALEVHIASTWGDPYYVGLAGIDIFDDRGRPVRVGAGAVTARPRGVCELEGHEGDPRTPDKLCDGVGFTCDARHMWLAPFDEARGATVSLRLPRPTRVAMIRLWNYNKSRVGSLRGARSVAILLDGRPLFGGEVRCAPGTLAEGPDACAEVILCTLDAAVLARIEAHDEECLVADRDGTADILALALARQEEGRPRTAARTAAGASVLRGARRSTRKGGRPNVLLRPRRALAGAAQRPQCPAAAGGGGGGERPATSLGTAAVAASPPRPPLVEPPLARAPRASPPAAAIPSSDPMDSPSVHVDAEIDRILESARLSDDDGDGDGGGGGGGDPPGGNRHNVSSPLGAGEPDWSDLLRSDSDSDGDRGEAGPAASGDAGRAGMRAGSEAAARGRGAGSDEKEEEEEEEESEAAAAAAALQRLAARPRLPRGQEVELEVISTWGDPYYAGLTGLELLVVGEGGAVEAEPAPRLEAEPADLNVGGHRGDPRVLSNLASGRNCTVDERDMWLVAVPTGGRAVLRVRAARARTLAGLRVWNYNKSEEDAARGVKRVRCRIDGADAGTLLFRRAPGDAWGDFGQLVSLAPPAPAPAKAPSPGAVVASSRSGREYEAPAVISGFDFTFVILSSWGDPYYVGLGGLRLVAPSGRPVPVTARQIVASPASVNDLPDALASGARDPRVPANLVRGDPARAESSWLAPRAASLVPGQPNVLRILFDEPVSAAALLVHNYAKTPARGVREMQLWVDGCIAFHGIFPRHDQAPKGHLVCFGDPAYPLRLDQPTTDARRGRKDEQAVVFINDGRAVARSGAPQPTSGVASRYSEPVDISKRPMTAIAKHGQAGFWR